MRTVAATLSLLALTSLPAFADETLQSTVGGTVTIEVAPPASAADAEKLKSAKTLTIRLIAPSAPAAEDDALKRCGDKWNKKLNEDQKARTAAGRKKLAGHNIVEEAALTRADYRRCMYECLPDPGKDGLACKPNAAAGPQAPRSVGP